MQATKDGDLNQANVQTDKSNEAVDPAPQPVGDVVHGGSGGGQVAVLVELLRQTFPLASEQPETIMNLFVRLDETFELGLFEDRILITRILPLVSGNLLVFVGNCLREGSNWTEFKARLLVEYFPYFVREANSRNDCF
jgi:hypothetical protein